MLRKTKLFVMFGVVSLTIAGSSLIVVNATNDDIDVKENGINNHPSFYDTSDYYHSNKYTNFEYGLSPSDNQYEIESGDELLLENEKGTYYINKKNLAMKFKDKSGFIHSTTVNQYDDAGKRLLNATNYDIATSAINIMYYDYGNNNYSLIDESMGKNKESKLLEFNKKDNGYEARYFFATSGIELKIIVDIDGDSFSISIPDDGIKETYSNYQRDEKTDYRLGAINVYSYFGGVNSNTIDGYNFIPDGTGALIRYKETEELPYNNYRKDIYGQDISRVTSGSINSQSLKISMPVFGYVHGVNKHGMVGIVEDGGSNGQIIATNSSTKFPFYRVYPEFIYRTVYVQPMSSAGTSIRLIQDTRDNFDIKVRYQFLEEADASYVGMAKAYRNYLLSSGKMVDHELSHDNIPLRVDTIGQEVTKGSLFNKKVIMTTFKEYSNIVEDIKEKITDNVFGVYHGYTSDGTTWAYPKYRNFSANLGSIRNIKNLDNTYFFMDTSRSHERNGSYTTSKYISKRINLQLMSETINGNLYYYLNPDKIGEVLTSNIHKLSSKGANNFAIDGISNLLYSSFAKNGYTRSEAISEYKKALDGIDANLLMYKPNDYMLKYTSKNLDYSMYSSQYLTFDDTVPFTSIVMSGKVEMYSTYINFFANVRDDLLRMIDFDVYPSFMITNRASSKLDETPLNYIYASKYTDFEEAMKVYYDFVNEPLSKVIDASIIDRTVVAEGVVKVDYDNGISIVVNYLNDDLIFNGETVKAKNYLVLGGDN